MPRRSWSSLLPQTRVRGSRKAGTLPRYEHTPAGGGSAPPQATDLWRAPQRLPCHRYAWCSRPISCGSQHDGACPGGWRDFDVPEGARGQPPSVLFRLSHRSLCGRAQTHPRCGGGGHGGSRVHTSAGVRSAGACRRWQAIESPSPTQKMFATTMTGRVHALGARAHRGRRPGREWRRMASGRFL